MTRRAQRRRAWCRRSTTWLLCAIALVWLRLDPPAALASCAPPVSLEEYRDRADLVVLGTVQGAAGRHVNVAVERYFKGQGPQLIRVTGRQSDDPRAVTSVDFEFQDGSRYLLFLRKSATQELRTDACAGNRPVGSQLTAEEAGVLGDGSAPRPTAAFPEASEELMRGASIVVSLAAVVSVWVLVLWRRRISRG